MTGLRNTILNADCLKAMPMLPDGSVDFILTDPPYITRYKSRTGARSRTTTTTAGSSPPLSKCTVRSRKTPSASASTAGPRRTNSCRHTGRQASASSGILRFPNATFPPRVIFATSRSALIFSRRAIPSVPITRSATSLNGHIAATGCIRLHPTQKPLSILSLLIKTFCRKEGTVLDPFAGSGSTLMAAKALNRSFIGIELDAVYCAIARQRLGL